MTAVGALAATRISCITGAGEQHMAPRSRCRGAAHGPTNFEAGELYGALAASVGEEVGGSE